MQTAKPLKEHSLDLRSDIVRCLIYSVGVQKFSAPFNLSSGDMTGTVMMIHYLIGIPVSISSFLSQTNNLLLLYQKLVYCVTLAAFVITVETSKILGKGFKPILPKEK